MNRDYATSGYLWPGYLGEGIYSSGLTISQELARVSIRYYTELHSRIRMEQQKLLWDTLLCSLFYYLELGNGS
jgi:hypothetical protein